MLLNRKMCMMFVLALGILCLLAGRAPADEIRLASGGWIRNCKVERTGNGYEIRMGPGRSMRFSADALDLSTLKRGETTWKDTGKPGPKPDPKPEPKPPDPKPKPDGPLASSKLMAFMAAAREQQAAAGALAKKKLVVYGDTVRETTPCKGCKGTGRKRESVSARAKCSVCGGKGRTLGAGGKMVSCRPCSGRGYQRKTSYQYTDCRSCNGSGSRYGTQKGTVNDLQLLVPEVGRFVKARSAATKAASDLLSDPKTPAIPEKAFTLAIAAFADLARNEHHRDYIPAKYEILPQGKELLLTEFTVAATARDGVLTKIVIRHRSRDRDEDDPGLRAVLRVPGRPQVKIGRSLAIRGHVTGTQDGILILGEYQLYPKDLFKRSR